MTARFVTDPVRQRELERAGQEQAARHAALRASIGDREARQFAVMLQTYPTLSAELAQGVFAAGASQVSAAMATVATREERVRAQTDGVLGWLKRNVADRALGVRNWLFDQFKTGARGFFTVAEGMWEELLARPFRTAVGMGQGMDPAEAWSEAGASDLLYAIREMRAGRRANLGSGFLPKSDNPAESEVYRQAIEEGLSEEQALAKATEELGAPITEEARQQRETGITWRGQPVSPGRVFAGIFTEPGSREYGLLSGLVDAGTRLILDPSARTLRGLSFARKGAQIISGPGESALSARGLAARNFAAGLVPGIRKTVRGTKVESFLASAEGRRVAEVIANTEGDDAFVLIKNLLQHGNPTPVNGKLVAGLAAAKDPTAVLDLLRPHLGVTVLNKPIRSTLASELGLPSLSRGLGSLLGGPTGGLGGFGVGVRMSLANTRLGRLFERMPGVNVRYDEIDDGLRDLDDYMISLGWGDTQRSKHLTEWARLDSGDSVGAYAVMKKVARDLEDDLVKPRYETLGGVQKKVYREVAGKRVEVYDGIPRVLARKVTRYFDDAEGMREYMNSQIGGSGWWVGAETIQVEGRTVVVPTAKLISEYLHRAIPLPDARMLRRAFSEVDKLHRITIGARKGAVAAARGEKAGFQRAMSEALGEAGELSAVERGTLEQVVDFYMHKIWKPMVLLRLAWPVRVVGEEQVRLAGAGLASLFSHPISYIAWQTQRGKTGVEELIGAAKKFGAGADEYADLRMADWHKAGSSVGAGGWIDERGVAAVTATRGGRKGFGMYRLGSPQHLDVWASKLAQHADDPIAKALMTRPFDEVAESFWSGKLMPLRKLLAKGSSTKAARYSTREGSDLYLKSVQADIAMLTGGDAQVLSRRTGLTFRPDVDDWRDAEYHIRPGDTDLAYAIQTGKLRNGVKVANLNSRNEVNLLKRTLRNDGFVQFAPEHVEGATFLGAEAKNLYDKAVDAIFTYGMSKITNLLSRSPALRQFYWQRVEELMPWMSGKAYGDALRAAKAAKLGGATLGRMEAIKPAAAGTAGLIDNMAQVETLAGGFACYSTKQLLYDLATRHRVSDMLHNVFPFGEAYLEILSTWGRLMYRNPQILRRGQQIVEGARGAGIFYTDPVSGQEVFAYPGGGLISDWMFGDDSPASLRLQGSVQGLNLMTGSYLPGFGPTVQIPASYFLPDTPSADGLRKLILPFGNVKAGSPGGIIDAAMPAWMKKMVQAMEAPGATSEFARLQGNTTTEVMRAMLLTGKWNTNTPEAQDALIRSASHKSTLLTLIRGAAQFFSPTGPLAAFQVDTRRLLPEDTEGRVYFFQTLTTEYYDKLTSVFDGDETEAMRWFIGAYGFNPYDIVTPKTQVVSRRHTTGPGNTWARNNEDLFAAAAYPHTAYYARPDEIDEEFDYQAYIRQLDTGARVGYTPQQWVVAHNQTIGRIRYQHYKEQLRGRTDIYARQYLSEIRAWLETQYPGYGHANVGTVVRPDSGMILEELARWKDEPRLAESEAGMGLTAYLDMISWAETLSVAQGYSRNGYQQADRLIGVRMALRAQAEALMAQYPDFAGLWRYTFEPLLQNDYISRPEETMDTLLDELTGGTL